MDDDLAIPTKSQFDGLIRVCDEEKERVNGRLIRDRKDANKAVNKWDWEKNYGRRAFRATKCNYSPPTTHLAHPTKKGEYVTKADDIHEQFKERWTKVFRLHPQNCDFWIVSTARTLPMSSSNN